MNVPDATRYADSDPQFAAVAIACVAVVTIAVSALAIAAIVVLVKPRRDDKRAFLATLWSGPVLSVIAFSLLIAFAHDTGAQAEAVSAAAAKNYGVTLDHDEARKTVRAAVYGKNSDTFTVGGHGKVYASPTAKKDTVVLRDAKTDEELPRR